MHFLSALPQDKPWQVDIKEYKPNRSNSQNALYWKWLEVVSAFMGEDKEDLHERFAVKFLGVDEKEVIFRDESGQVATEIIRRPRSTKNLTTKEFSDYLNKIEITIATAFPDFRLPIPDDYKLAMGA